MLSAVEFNAHVDVIDRNPEILHNEDYWAYRGKPFRSERYNCIANRQTEWRWTRSGPLLNKDGSPRKDGEKGHINVPEHDVPDYVMEALHAVLATQAAQAHAEIDAWVAAAAALVPEQEVRI